MFNLNDLITNTRDGIDNHYFTLIRRIIKIYINLRLNYITKQHNNFLQLNNDSQAK